MVDKQEILNKDLSVLDEEKRFEVIENFFILLECQKIKIVEDDFNLNLQAKEFVLKIFPYLEAKKMQSGDFVWLDKIPIMKNIKGFRVVPGAVIRRGVSIGDSCVIMPSFINVGSRIGDKTMIDSGVTVGSCAYIGKNCHISSNTVIAGVLEPVSAMPVIIEDDVFIGAQCLISEGIKVAKGCVIGAGTSITASTKIIDRDSGQEYQEIPPYSVIVPGGYKSGNFYTQCALVVKKIDAQTRKSVSINQVLRS